MIPLRGKLFCAMAWTCLFLAGLAGCKAKADNPQAATSRPPFMSTVATAPPQPADDAPPPDNTGGFDGKRAFAHVARQVAFGPRPAGSAALAQTQDYIVAELKSYGCMVETDAFSADTPAGRLPMKNILVKMPGSSPGIILLGTHYDTKRLENFVGADDGGSSTGVMLELARLLCPKRGAYQVWITFFDGEEAVKDWSDTDSRYGSRQMAAKLAISGDVQKIKAFLLADIVGTRPLRFKRDSNSTPWLTDLVWKNAASLGYASEFVNGAGSFEDDHLSFRKRGVPVVDVINLENYPGGNLYYWHTPQDTLDKVSAKSLSITSHVFHETL